MQIIYSTFNDFKNDYLNDLLPNEIYDPFSKDKTRIPSLMIKGKEEKSYNLPVGSHIIIEEGDAVTAGQVLVKIPRILGKLRDITGGLPRVTELFEARNPGNPAVVSEIDGVVSFGAIKRGNREITVEA